jgi:hypothetical protein
MRIGARQATEVRAEPAANARDEEAHCERDRRRLLPRAAGLRTQKNGADGEDRKQRACPKKDGNHRYVIE